MKRFKSIKRALKRGHLTVKYDSATKTNQLYRKTNSGGWILY